MKKMSLSLVAAGALAVAGLAHADAVFYPNGTEVDVSPGNTMVLGAGPATTTEYVYVQPNTNWDPVIAREQLRRNGYLPHRAGYVVRHQAAATFDVPARAGDASTMTGGAPNVATDNRALVMRRYSIPYAAVAVNEPYYVFSY
jgi:hypothetical protein